MSDFKEAIKNAQEAVEATSEDHSDRSGRLSNFEILFGDRHSRTRAMSDLEEASQVAQGAEDHQNWANWRNEAEKQMMETRKTLLDVQSLDVLTIDFKLASTYGQRHYEEAEAIDRETLKLGDRVIDRSFLASLEAKGLLCKLGELDKAVFMQQEVLQKRQQREHSDIITTMHNLGSTFSDQNKLDEAASMQPKMLEKSQRVFDNEYSSIISAINNFVNIFLK